MNVDFVNSISSESCVSNDLVEDAKYVLWKPRIDMPRGPESDGRGDEVVLSTAWR